MMCCIPISADGAGNSHCIDCLPGGADTNVDPIVSIKSPELLSTQDDSSLHTVNKNNNDEASSSSKRQSRLTQIVDFLVHMDYCYLVYFGLVGAPQMECSLCATEHASTDLKKHCTTVGCDSFVCSDCAERLAATRAQTAPLHTPRSFSTDLCPWCRRDYNPPILDFTVPRCNSSSNLQQR